MLFASFCLVLYLCVIVDNTNMSLNKVGNIPLLKFSTGMSLSDTYSLSTMMQIKALCGQKILHN